MWFRGKRREKEREGGREGERERAPQSHYISFHQMNGGMIRGSDVRVEVATRENGYVELTAEAAKNPWAVIGKFLHYSCTIKP